ncbi:MAG: SWIM zinc finger domain-containing protein [Chloroflexi bacterium]|nr:SWIM zinc finger domain-containing protein [Chloroflexota bacterium]
MSRIKALALELEERAERLGVPAAAIFHGTMDAAGAVTVPMDGWTVRLTLGEDVRHVETPEAGALALVRSTDLRSFFLRENPRHLGDVLGERWTKGVDLWRQGAIYRHDAASGCYRIRCEHPERTRPGESTAYWARLAPLDCECGDWNFRHIPCKHIVAAYLYRRMGPAPVPGRVAA